MIRRLLVVLGEEHQSELRRCIAGFAVGAVLQGIGFGLLVPILRALLRGDTGEATGWELALVALVVAYGILHFVAQLTAYRAATEVTSGLFQRVGDHLSTLPLGWFSGAQVGSVSRLTSQGVMQVMGVPAHMLRPLISAVVTPATVIVMMYLFDWHLALAATVAVPIASLVYRWSTGLHGTGDAEAEAAAAEAATRVVEFAQAQAVLRAFGRAAEDNALLEGAFTAQERARRRVLLADTIGSVAFGITAQLIFTGLLLLGTDLALGGTIEAAELVALLVLAVRFVEPLSLAADLGGAIHKAGDALTRLDDLLGTPPLSLSTSPREPRDSSIELDHVDFSYGGEQVLHDVSISVPANTMYALVGPSGSGKTTVTRLIARFWDVQSGTVRVGGEDVRDLDPGSHMSQVSMVFQDVYLFDGTIRENVLLGRPAATADEVTDAARVARLDEVIERLPNGWDTRVGEGGFALSGGERQRVAIARALLKDAPIVLLDEATASLDPVNEAAVHGALSQLLRRRTLLVIAHRLQTVVAADQIVVLDQGRVTATGTHQELLAAGGTYADFWAERTKSRGWRLADRS